MGLVFKLGRNSIVRCRGLDMLIAISASALERSKLLISRGCCTPALLIRQSISGCSFMAVCMNLGMVPMFPVSRM